MIRRMSQPPPNSLTFLPALFLLPPQDLFPPRDLPPRDQLPPPAGAAHAEEAGRR